MLHFAHAIPELLKYNVDRQQVSGLPFGEWRPTCASLTVDILLLYRGWMKPLVYGIADSEEISTPLPYIIYPRVIVATATDNPACHVHATDSELQLNPDKLNSVLNWLETMQEHKIHPHI